jgi:glycine cleavage system regulatory protein
MRHPPLAAAIPLHDPATYDMERHALRSQFYAFCEALELDLISPDEV